LINSITPALIELSTDKNWRIRKQNIENLIELARNIVFYKKLKKKKWIKTYNLNFLKYHKFLPQFLVKIFLMFIGASIF
jgi:hypothetical protein